MAVQSLEMVMAYMIAFRSFTQARIMDRKAANNYQHWDDLMPHFLQLRLYTRDFKALEGLATQLHAVCLEQLVVALGSSDVATVSSRLVSAERKRTDAWIDAFNCIESVDDSALRVTVGPWHNVEEALRITLPRAQALGREGGRPVGPGGSPPRERSRLTLALTLAAFFPFLGPPPPPVYKIAGAGGLCFLPTRLAPLRYIRMYYKRRRGGLLNSKGRGKRGEGGWMATLGEGAKEFGKPRSLFLGFASNFLVFIFPVPRVYGCCHDIPCCAFVLSSRFAGRRHPGFCLTSERKY